MKLHILFKCNEATHVCDKAQYNESSTLEKAFLQFHKLICKFCRKHSQNNSKLTHSIKQANLKTLSPSEKEVLKSRLNEKMS